MGRLARFLVDLLLAKRGLATGLIGFSVAALIALAPPADLATTWFDTMNQIWPRPRTSQPVLIVTIDEASVEAVGAWPWPRAVNAELMERIAAGNPAAVGIDIIYAEEDSLGAHRFANHPDAPPVARDWLRSLRSGDHAIVEALGKAPFVLAVGDVGQPPRDPSDLGEAMLESGHDVRPKLHEWIEPFQPLRSHGEIREAAAGEGVVAQLRSFDGVARRTGQVFDIGNDTLAPGLVTEMFRVAAGAQYANVDGDENGVRHVTLVRDGSPILRYRTETDGSVRPWYSERTPDIEIPAIYLMQDDDALTRLDGKLVLVGYAAAGGLDERISPLGELMPGVEAHRQTIESIFDGMLLFRPHWAPAAEFAAALALALGAAFAPLRLSLGWGAAAGLGLVAAPVVASLAAYVSARLVFDGATPAVGVACAGGLTLIAAMARAERARRASVASRQRIDGEMAAARRIQMGILPKAEETFPAVEARFSIAASMEPARTVGGDLYDFFLLDDRRLFFLVGDVAGKGPEASLFMAISKALCKSAALRGEVDIGRILTAANAEIARDNPATMFVTVFAGVLDVESGALDYCCAGHEPPWRIAAGGDAYRLEGEGGPPLCLLDAFDFPTDRVQLDVGDMILVVTDGVTEAANRAGKLFGVERTEAAIPALVGAPDAATALERLIGPVHAYADGAEPADDLTALALIWRGAASRN